MPTQACRLERFNLGAPVHCQFSLSKKVHILGLVDQAISEGGSLTRTVQSLGVSKASVLRWCKDLQVLLHTYSSETMKAHQGPACYLDDIKVDLIISFISVWRVQGNACQMYDGLQESWSVEGSIFGAYPPCTSPGCFLLLELEQPSSSYCHTHGAVPS
jgi:hypothetical protein